MPTSALAQEGAYNEAYGVLVQTYSDDGSTLVDSYLTMYYDNKKKEHTEGIALGLDEMLQDPNMMQARRTLHSVIFDQSFAACDTIKSTKGWFAYCMELKTISGLEYLNTSEVTDMDIMFMECSALESLDLSHFNTSKVTTMSNMFFFCENLKTLDLSSFNTENVTDMSYMFGNCMGLTTIYVGSYWSTASVTESDGMFSGCSSLVGGAGTTFSEDHTDKAYAHIDRADQPGYLTYGQSGGKGEAEPYAVLSEDNTTLTFYYDEQKASRNGMNVGPFEASTEDGNFSYDNVIINSGWNNQRETIKEVIFDDSFANCLTISSTAYWFFEFRNLTKIIGISNLKTTNDANMAGMFYRCSSLVDLDVSGFNTDLVTNMSAMFYGCSSVTNLDVGGFNTQKVNSMDDMFCGCSSLTKLDVSGFNTDNVMAVNHMFEGCSGLTVLDLSNFNTDKVEWIDNMFYGCSSLTTIYAKSSWNLRSLDNSSARYLVFNDCVNLVGGNGTKYDSNHIDYTYARIDKDGEPGYFTDIADKGKEKEQITATPTWEFQNNMLALLCKTEGAEINYAMENWTTEEEADSISKAMDVIAKSVVYKDPIEVTDNIVIKMYALKEGLRTSKDTTFIYDYKSWSELYDVIRYGVEISEKAQASGKVEEGLIEELKWALNEGDHMYQMRAEVSNQEAKYFTQAIVEACKKIEEQMNATSGKVETPTFSFNGDSLVISTTTEDALIWYQSASIDSTFVDGFAQYSGPIFIGDIKMNAKATKEGMEDSEVASMVYYYTEWQELIETTYICDKVLSEILQSKPSENIIKMIDDVYVELAYVRDEYGVHRLEWDRDKIEDEIMKLKHVVAEIEEEWKKESSEATYENLTLTVGGANTMATALEMVGGRAEVTKDIAAIVWNSTEPLTKSDLEGFDNPNMLIFVNEASMAPEGVENVVVDGKAKSIVLIDTDSINNNFYAPQEFTAESISYTREFKQTTQKDVSRGWEGICLPFTVQSYTHESHGAIAPFRNDNSEFHFWLHQMTEQGMATATNIEANMPYIISMPNNTSYPATYNQAGKVTFSAKNAVVPVSVPSMIHLSDGSIGIGGIYNSLPKMEGFYALNVGDDMDEYPEGSVFVNNYRTIRPFEVYSYHAGRSAGTRSIISVASLFTGGVDGATGILDATDKQDSDEVKVYSVNGILLKKGNRNEVMNSLPKGLYIIGNQKVMVK